MTDNIQQLLDWAKSSGSYLHPDVEIYEDSITGLSFRAKQTIPPDTAIVSGAYRTSLSYLNAIGTYTLFPCTDPFPSNFLKALEKDNASVIGYFFLMQQYLLGRESLWWAYIRMLPQPDDLQNLSTPIWWPKVDQAFLKGTNAEPSLKERRSIWVRQWEQGISLLSELPGHHNYTYLLYQWAASIFDSRSFRPSLTINLDLIQCELKAGQDPVYGDSLSARHIRSDEFSILYPLVDIGNHNSVNQVRWEKNGNDNSFHLVHSSGVPRGEQIYNYYGNKSNSELLLAYGFILPPSKLVNRDVVNIKLKANPLALDVTRAEHNNDSNAYLRGEKECIFSIQASQAGDSRAPELHCFSQGLVERMCSLVINERERLFIGKHPEQIHREFMARPFEGPLCRSMINAVGILRNKVESELERIAPEHEYMPQNPNQTLALRYRAGQLATLEIALNSLDTFLNQVYSPASLTHINVKILSIEQAYHLLTQDYPTLSATIQHLISEDQDEPLPLDWYVLMEDWSYTLWTLWIFVATYIQHVDYKDPIHGKPLDSHIAGGLENLIPYYRETSDNKPNTFHGAADELSTLTPIIKQLQDFYPEIFPDDIKNIVKIRNMASWLVKEELFDGLYEMRGGSMKGKRVNQKLLCFW